MSTLTHDLRVFRQVEYRLIAAGVRPINPFMDLDGLLLPLKTYQLVTTPIRDIRWAVMDSPAPPRNRR
jgi:hypothetical protein